MKATITIIASLFFGMFISTQAYSQLRHDSYRIVVGNFSSDGSTVNVDYSVGIIPSRVHTREAVDVRLYMQNGGRETTLGTFRIVGRQRMNSFRRAATLRRVDTVTNPDYVFMSDSPQTTINFSDSFAYEEWMNGARLYASEISTGCRNSASETTAELAALRRIAVTPPPAAPVVEVPAPAKEVVVRELTAFFSFPVNKSVLDMTFERNMYEWDRVVNYIKEIESVESGRIATIELTGYASPEGPYLHNEKLAADRAKAVAERLLRTTGLNLNPEQIITNSVAEDWDGLVSMMQNTGFAYKNQVVGIIERYGIFDGREKQLMLLDGGRIYRMLLKDYFPQLRRTEFRITYEK